MPRNIMSQRSPQMPSGTEVAAFRTHEEATAAVERLADEGFPLPAVTIVGSDLHLAERIMGKMTPAKVAISGAAQGLTWGLMMAIFSILFYPGANFIIPLILVCAGVLIGMIISTVAWAMSKSRGNFAVQSTMVATRYAVLVAEMPDRAFRLLSGMPGNLTGQPRRPSRRDEPSASGIQVELKADEASTQTVDRRPTEYGSRKDEAPRFGVRLADRPQGSAPDPEPLGEAEAAPSAESAGKGEN